MYAFVAVCTQHCSTIKTTFFNDILFAFTSKHNRRRSLHNPFVVCPVIFHFSLSFAQKLKNRQKMGASSTWENVYYSQHFAGSPSYFGWQQVGLEAKMAFWVCERLIDCSAHCTQLRASQRRCLHMAPTQAHSSNHIEGTGHRWAVASMIHTYGWLN